MVERGLWKVVRKEWAKRMRGTSKGFGFGGIGFVRGGGGGAFFLDFVVGPVDGGGGGGAFSGLLCSVVIVIWERMWRNMEMRW